MVVLVGVREEEEEGDKEDEEETGLFDGFSQEAKTAKAKAPRVKKTQKGRSGARWAKNQPWPF